MATAEGRAVGPLTAAAGLLFGAFAALGDWALFATQTVRWLTSRRPVGGTLLPVFYSVGVRSVLVVGITGAFIGMVLSVQTYGQFHQLGLDTSLGAIINMSVVRELGPVLAATMLAGRVGSAMAAELATMRVTEQIDAIACLGVNPVHYLVVPRLLACVLLIPLLTIFADMMGVAGSAAICLKVFFIEPHHYWMHSREYVGLWDVFSGLLKSIFFGAAIALIACHRGFNSRAGSEGVGRAATEAFVLSFVAILALDFVLALTLNTLHDRFGFLSGPSPG
jgi:phospholipid/cholesterol/gamma-HCH transport system permease protein